MFALIIEKVSEKSYKQYLYENLRKLSGMESTGYSRPKNSPDQIAISYENNNET